MRDVVGIDFVRNMYCLQVGRATIGEWFWYRDLELMQSTGLKDKNGVDIFEGDVGWDVYGEEYGQVVFEEGCFRFETDELSEALFEVNDDIEIVGNIYENPELLEPTNE